MKLLVHYLVEKMHAYGLDNHFSHLSRTKELLRFQLLECEGTTALAVSNGARWYAVGPVALSTP